MNTYQAYTKVISLSYKGKVTKQMIQKARQYAFNKMVRGLEGQKWVQSKERGADGACLFRGPRNRKCAVGFIIPDHRYTKEMELNEPYDAAQYCRLNFTRLGIDFLRDCQAAHDDCEKPGDMRESFYLLSEKYGLKWVLPK